MPPFFFRHHRSSAALLSRVARLLVLALCCAHALPAVEPVQVVATGGRLGNSFYTPAAGNTAFRHRTPHKLGGPVAEMRIGFLDWAYGYGDETPNAVNDVTIGHAWLERASTGQVVPLTFAGSRRLVLPMNSTAAYWLSDAVPSSAWTGAAPARDEVFWLHLQGSIPDGGQIPSGTPASYSGARFIVYPSANDPGTFDTAGAVPSITGSTARIAGLPVIFLGRYAGPGHLSVIGIGDSILDGTGDAANPVPVISGFGFLDRAALDTNGANAIAMFNLTRHGQSAANFVKAAQTRHPQFLRFANVVVEEYGTNDLGSGGTGNTTTILSNVDKIWTAARNAGVQKIIRTKLMPRTTSTDSWATLTNQTPNTGWESGGKRDTINTGFQTALTQGKIDVLLDTLSVLADPSDDSRWLTNGAAKYTTTDGTHLGTTGNALLAPSLRAALLSLTVDENAPNYSNWSKTIAWNGADPTPEGDANDDGISNLLAYALAINPLAHAPITALPALALDSDTPDGPWLCLDYRENANADDLLYAVKSSSDLVNWTDVVPDGVNAVSEIANSDPDGDGGAILRRVRVPFANGKKFLRLSVLR